MAKSTAARAAARFRQLSCLGLHSEAVIPELLRELHALIPSFSNTFHFADERGGLANIYFENTDLLRLWPLYQQQILERSERDVKGLAFSDGSREQLGVHEFNEAVRDDQEYFHRSDYYNLIVRRVGYDSNFLRVYFREKGRVLGGLTVWRSPSAIDWTEEDKRKLAALSNFFVHALTAGKATETPLVDGGDNGLIIATTDGKPVYFSAEGRRLLFLAANPNSLSDSAVARSATLPAQVARLCVSLSRIFSDEAASTPVYRHTNVWGGFTFRAQWLDHDEPAAGLIAITISHKVPLAIRVMRSVRKLSLSRRQTEVCVLMATGASTDAVAQQLGISKHTANQHGRWIYNKLEVHSRTELVSKLLTVE